jgi:anti-anti-sigma factor
MSAEHDRDAHRGGRDGELTGRLVVRASSARPEELQVAGELDLATRDVLLAVARGRRRKAGDLRLDATGVSFVDLAGLASLLEVARETRAAGARFELTGSSSSLSRLVRLTGMQARLGG